MRLASKKIAVLAENARFEERALFLRNRVWPELEKFLIAGPTLLGFVPGILGYLPGSIRFEVAFQSLCIFVSYLGCLVFLQLIDSLFSSSVPVILAAMRSVLAAAYLILTMKQYLEWRTGNVNFYPAVQKIRSRLAKAIGHGG